MAGGLLVGHCDACDASKAEVEDMRRRLVRAIIVIEALKRRLSEFEQGGQLEDEHLQFASPIEALGSDPLEMGLNRSTEVSGLRFQVNRLEAQLAEKDVAMRDREAYVQRLEEESRISREAALGPGHLAELPHAAMAFGLAGSGGCGGAPPQERERTELLNARERLKACAFDLEMLRAENEELKSTIEARSPRRPAGDSPPVHHTAQGLQERERSRKKQEKLKEMWTRWLLIATQSLVIGTAFLRPLEDWLRRALSGMLQTSDGLPMMVVGSAHSVDIFTRQHDEKPTMSLRKDSGSWVQAVRGEHAFLLYGVLWKSRPSGNDSAQRVLGRADLKLECEMLAYPPMEQFAKWYHCFRLASLLEVGGQGASHRHPAHQAPAAASHTEKAAPAAQAPHHHHQAMSPEPQMSHEVAQRRHQDEPAEVHQPPLHDAAPIVEQHPGTAQPKAKLRGRQAAEQQRKEAEALMAQDAALPGTSVADIPAGDEPSAAAAGVGPIEDPPGKPGKKRLFGFGPKKK